MREIIIMYSLKMLQIFIASYFASVFEVLAATDKVFCYYESWDSHPPPENYTASVCTHINYAYLNIRPDGSLRLSANSANSTLTEYFQDLKIANPNMKFLFSVGGNDYAAKIFSEVAANDTKKAQLAASALKFLQEYEFDGIDIKWISPRKSDKNNLVDMLQVLRRKLKTSNDYLLTIAVGPYPSKSIYDASRISKLVDYVHIMAYDFHAISIRKTGQNVPRLGSSKGHDLVKIGENCHASIQNWRKAGIATPKLVLGLAFFGSSFKIKEKEYSSFKTKEYKVRGLGARTTGLTVIQLPYREICKLKLGWDEIWDSQQKIQFKHNKKDTWIAYDNPKSIHLKVQCAQELKIAGVMVSAVNQDDTVGSCGGKNALLESIKRSLVTHS